MMFEENSGLAEVVPYDMIQETVEIAVGKFAPEEESESAQVRE